MNAPLYIFDLDGTLADIRHRLHHVRLLPGSKVKAGGHAQAIGTYRGVKSNLTNDVWVEFEGTGEWAYAASSIKLVKDWNAFYAACVDDVPIKPVMSLMRMLSEVLIDRVDQLDIRIWSGRSDAVEAQTRKWLIKHFGWCPPLKMRPAGDNTPDDQLKERWLNELLPEDRARLTMVFDDRQRVVDMWRRNGVTCAQVAEGDF